MFKPYFLNHNIYQNKQDHFYDAIASNIGNSLISYALSCILHGKFIKLDGISNIWTADLSKYNPEKINKEYSHLILVMQDQIRARNSYYDKIDYTSIINFINHINLPFVVFSLGCNAFSDSEFSKLHKIIPKDLVYLLHVISDKTCLLGVRGHFTIDVLNRLGIKNTKIIGCPSFFITKTKKIIKRSISRVALTGDFLPNIDKRYSYYRILQDAIERTNLMKNEKMFSDILSWGNFIKKMDFVIGSRMHGAILALNKNVPAVVTSGDWRAKEMCSLFKIPLLAGAPPNTNITKIYNALDYSDMENNYPILYSNFLDYLTTHNLIDTSKEFCNATEDVQPTLSRNCIFL